jgi:hypothetical protein
MFAPFGVIWNWDKFKNLIPVVRTILAFFARRGPLPRPKGRRFAIAVARLVNDDEERSTENVVIAALKGFAGVEVLRFNAADTPKPFAKDPDSGRKAHSGAERGGFGLERWAELVC